MRLSILGAGAWGTALAVSVCRRHPTLLWTRDPAHAAELDRERSNRRYLNGVALPPALRTTADFEAAVAHAEDGLVVIATPMAGLALTLSRLSRSTAGILWLCKGFEQGSAALGHEVAAAIRPSPSGPDPSRPSLTGASTPGSGARKGSRVGVLSGPSFAIEVARGQPTALVVASHDAALRAEAVAALHGDGLRIYTSDDPVGVEVGGAVKNVFAIASGIADGMPGPLGTSGLGLNARAALVTRGLAEMTRLGVALGARAETFMGLSGVGDLVLTTTGDLSRNRRVGLLLAQGRPLPRILEELGHVAEGVSTAPMVLRRARSVGVEMPIVEAVADVIDGRTTPARALKALMGRDARTER